MITKLLKITDGKIRGVLGCCAEISIVCHQHDLDRIESFSCSAYAPRQTLSHMTRACHRQHWRDMLWPGNFLLGVEALHTLVEALQMCWINAARTKRSPIGSAALS